MKIWAGLILLTTCQAAVILAPRNPDDIGAAVTFQNQDVLGQYDFGYSEGHPSGASFRRESGDAYGNKVGSFGLRDSDGRIRVVRYVADANGFRAEVTSNEPGVAPQDPASATINKPSILPLAAAPVAPVAVPPPPPPPPAAVVVPQRVLPPPAVAYNYIPTGPVAVPPPPPPPPPAYFPPRVLAAPVAAPVAPVVAPYPAPVAPLAVAAPVPNRVPFPPPPAYYTNLVQGKGYVNAARNYASLVPPFAAVPPQYNYLSYKNPPAYQAVGFPL